MHFIKYLYFYIQVFQKQTEELIKSILGTKFINSTIFSFFDAFVVEMSVGEGAQCFSQ